MYLYIHTNINIFKQICKQFDFISNFYIQKLKYTNPMQKRYNKRNQFIYKYKYQTKLQKSKYLFEFLYVSMLYHMNMIMSNRI